MIRTCLFDMGNVLLHFCHERMCAQMGNLCGRTAAEVRALLIDSGLQRDFERGRHTEDDFRRRFGELVRTEIAADHLRAASSDIFTLNEPILPILDGLRAGGVRLVLLSNTSVAHFEFVRERYGVLDRFDEFVLSFEVGAMKPEPAIYEAALRAIRCAPGECFYTDDILDYVTAGRRFGLQAEVFTDVPSLRRHLEERGLEVPSATVA